MPDLISARQQVDRVAADTQKKLETLSLFNQEEQARQRQQQARPVATQMQPVGQRIEQPLCQRHNAHLIALAHQMQRFVLMYIVQGQVGDFLAS